MPANPLFIKRTILSPENATRCWLTQSPCQLRERWPDGKILNDLGTDGIYGKDRENSQ